MPIRKQQTTGSIKILGSHSPMEVDTSMTPGELQNSDSSSKHQYIVAASDLYLQSFLEIEQALEFTGKAI